MKRLALITAWLTAAHGVLGLIYWALLNVPESNVWMLGLSATLALVIAGGAAWTEVGAALAWQSGVSMGQALRRAASRLHAFAPFLLVCGAFVLATGQAAGWLARHRGEIDAWLIATFGWTQTAWLHTGLTVLLEFLRSIVGVSLALAVMAACARRGLGEVMYLRWVRAGLSRAQLGRTGLAMVLLVALPWRAVYWRPGWLPPNTIEVVVAGAKLLVIVLLMNLGWALTLRAAALGAAPPEEP